MTLHLYQQSRSEAFRLSKQTLLRMGYTILLTDERKGIISARKNGKRMGHWLFIDVKLTATSTCTSLLIIANEFLDTGVFIDDLISGSLFLETFHEMLCIQPPDNPMRLTRQDYALATGF
jgi:hypothetical protein